MRKLYDILLLVVIFGTLISLSCQNSPEIRSNLLEFNPQCISRQNIDWHWYLENQCGYLCYQDSCLSAFNINDYYVTPWGNCYWQGDAKGWQFYNEGFIGIELNHGK